MWLRARWLLDPLANLCPQTHGAHALAQRKVVALGMLPINPLTHDLEHVFGRLVYCCVGRGLRFRRDQGPALLSQSGTVAVVVGVSVFCYLKVGVRVAHALDIDAVVVGVVVIAMCH